MAAMPSQINNAPAKDATVLDWPALCAGQPVLWLPRDGLRALACQQVRSDAPDTQAAALGAMAPDAAGLQAAAQRLAWAAPLLAQLFPDELGPAQGLVESPLQAMPALQAALGLPPAAGSLFIKADHALPVAGSVKARGGFHEVLEHAEALAVRHGLLPADPADRAATDARVLAGPAARALFARHQVAVGSTGNLGLAIGVMAAALGFEAVVHMSADAKDWKKDRLRQRGVQVVAHPGDYAEAVAAGRAQAQADPRIHFVDDERSLSLFLGYAVAAQRLAGQLAAAGRLVDAEHPLLVYLPCGVGGAPGGIAWGLAQQFGPHVHCLWAEPPQSPCCLLGLAARHPATRRQHPGLAALAAQASAASEPPSVYDIGLTNRTEADGLAVPRASALALAAAGPHLAGAYTVSDDDLHRLLHQAASAAQLRLEPSACAGLAGPGLLWHHPGAQGWLADSGVGRHLARATHIAWTTGGHAVPEAELQRFRVRGAALAASAFDDPALHTGPGAPAWRGL